MTDKELLEMAAKAAGYNIEWRLASTDLSDGAETWFWFKDGLLPWTPLMSNGEALRLAVDLRINVELTARTVLARQDGTADEDAILDLLGDDPHAATRRAIVRAAADLGRML